MVVRRVQKCGEFINDDVDLTGKDPLVLDINAHQCIGGEDLKDAYCIVVTAPSGKQKESPFYDNYTYFVYSDPYGYCFPVIENGRKKTYETRLSPEEEGMHSFVIYNEKREPIHEGTFQAVYNKKWEPRVGVSKNDKHYFAYSDGRCFVPIGVDYSEPKMDLAPDDDGFHALNYMKTNDTHQYRSRVTRDYRRVCDKMKENGANLMRISIAATLFDARPEFYDKCNYSALALLDMVIEQCRTRQIKVILNLDGFHSFRPGHYKSVVKRTSDGRIINNAAAYLRSEACRREWLTELLPYLYRYGNDPNIFAFELFSDMDAIEEIDMETIEDFTEYVIKLINRSFPDAMVVNSLSMCDSEAKKANQRRMGKLGTAFDQINRCFDITSELPECREIPREMAATAISEFRQKRKPILLARTGAVQDKHGAPFLYYRTDHEGILFKDTVFSPFFAGAAGTGIIVHTLEYIEANNMWEQYKAFSDMIKTVKVDKQHWKFSFSDRKWCWIMYMHGRTTTLAFIRNRSDRWDYALRDQQQTVFYRGIRIKCQGGKRAKVYPFPNDLPMPDKLELRGDEFWLPTFAKGMFLRIR